MSSYLNKDNSIIHTNTQFLRYITKKLGIQPIISLILTAESEKPSQNKTLFQCFVDELRFNDCLSIEEQQEYLMDYLKHESLLTPLKNKGRIIGNIGNKEQSLVSFENKLIGRQLDTESFSFNRGEKIVINSQNNINLELLKKKQGGLNDNKEKIGLKNIEKAIILPRASHLKNPKSSDITHKTEELPSFYSGRLFDQSHKENFNEFEKHKLEEDFMENNLENRLIEKEFQFHSLKAVGPIRKCWSEKELKQEEEDEVEEEEEGIGDRKESRSYY